MTSAPTTSAPAAPQNRYALAFIFVTVLLDMIGFGLIMPVVPALIESVGHTDVAGAAAIYGWMVVAFSVAQFIFGPVMGSLSDSFGRRPLLLLAVGGLAIDYVIAAVAPTLFWLFVGRVFAGVCGASVVIASAYIADVTRPEDRARAFGMIGAAFGVGFVIGPAIGGLLGEFGPRVPFWVAAGIAALNFLFGLLILPESLPAEKRRRFDIARANPFGVFRVFASYGKVLPLLAVLALYFFASSVYPAIWAFWGTARFGWSEAMIGGTLAVLGILAAIVQGGLSGPSVRWFGEYRVVVGAMLMGGIMAFFYGLAGSTVTVFVLLVLHAPEGLAHPVMTAILSRSVPEDAQGELQGGLSAVMNLMMMFGTVFFTHVFSRFLDPGNPAGTAGVSYYIAGVLILAALALFLWLGRKGPVIPEAPLAGGGEGA